MPFFVRLIDLLCLELVEKGLVTDSISLYVGYSRRLQKKSAHGTITMPVTTSSAKKIDNYTDGNGMHVLDGGCISTEKETEAVCSQIFQSLKNLQRLPVWFYAFILLSICIWQKRAFLSYLQFYLFPLARFLCELCIRLEKDGKKRDFAF